jgi:hypothetical protein
MTLLCHHKDKIKLFFQEPKMEQDLKKEHNRNIHTHAHTHIHTHTHTHTAFDSLLCVEIFSLYSGMFAFQKERSEDVSFGCPFESSAACLPAADIS